MQWLCAHLDVADVAGLEAKGTRALRWGKGGQARSALQVEVPLVRCEVPVQLTHSAGLERDEG